MSRAIDHLVLASHDLDDVAGAYRRLGFLVGGRNRHPWGTENHIVQLDGSFLELIGFARDFQPLSGEHAAAPFTGAIARHLQRGDGLALVALRSNDAEADAAHFATLGLGRGTPLRFARTAEAADGTRREVAFTIAYAIDPAAPTAAYFVCQHHRPENFWNAAAQRHPNTARGLKGIVATAEHPGEQAEFFRSLFGEAAVATQDDGLMINAGEHVIELLTASACRARYGDAALTAARGQEGFVAYRVGVDSVEAVQRFLNVLGSPYELRDGHLIIPPGIARGVVLSFEPQV